MVFHLYIHSPSTLQQPSNPPTDELEMEDLDAFEWDISKLVPDDGIPAGAPRAIALNIPPAVADEHLATELRGQNADIPINQLPNELLAYIFKLAHSSLSPERSPEPAIHFLSCASGVCSRWREVVHGTPSLWSTISSSSDRSDFQKTCKAIWKILLLSNGSPLDIFLTLRMKQWQVEEILAILLPHSKRWRVFSLSLPLLGYNCAKVREQLGAIDVDALQHFSLHVDYGDGRPQSQTGMPVILVNGAPQLSFLRLSNAMVKVNLPTCSSLRTLELGTYTSPEFTWDEFKTHLASFPALENLSLVAFKCHVPQRPTLQDTLILPHLRRLRFHQPNCAVFGGLLPLIQFPVLEQLSLFKIADTEVKLNTRYPQVKFIDLERWVLDESGYRNLFKIFPNVEHVVLGAGCQMILRILAKDDPPAWSSLTTLSVKSGFARSSGWEIVLQLMHARESRMGIPLKLVRMDPETKNYWMAKEEWPYTGGETMLVGMESKAMESWMTWPTVLAHEDPHANVSTRFSAHGGGID